MVYTNIKNTSVQLVNQPTLQVRLVTAANKEEINQLADGDILSAKAAVGLMSGVTVVNALDSVDTVSALAAAQGKILKDLIDALTRRVAALEAKP